MAVIIFGGLPAIGPDLKRARPPRGTLAGAHFISWELGLAVEKHEKKKAEQTE